MNLSYIIWNVDPDIFIIPGIDWPLKWYGVMWLVGFVVSQQLMFHFFKKDGKKAEDVESLTLYIFIATIIGARFGHFLFYEPSTFLTDPLQIILPPYAGLASHGAAIGILTGLYLFCRNKNYNYFWMLDRLVIVVAFTGGCIRVGNLLNSEIVGTPTDVPWGFVFVRNGEDFARHPAQLYEGIFCFILFTVLFLIWKNRKAVMYNGLIFGIFLITLFGQRFFVEFFKENQEAFEDQLALNMGQVLSIPFVLIGIFVLYWSYKVKSRTSTFRLEEVKSNSKAKKVTNAK
ncbi:MAG TPA: prolipoprotein diacylglyceryl transferase [Cytophagales bacterium]|nr:prolipoprotein diacylglyceryl transferase [Cytophagales bacterium]